MHLAAGNTLAQSNTECQEQITADLGTGPAGIGLRGYGLEVTARSPHELAMGADALTVAQMLTAYSALARDGSKAAGIVRGMLERVVTEGTGRRAAVPGLRIAGKTGTVGGEGRQRLAIFAGFAPAAEPRIAVYVAIEDPSPAGGQSASGGKVAAPVFREVLEQALPR